MLNEVNLTALATEISLGNEARGFEVTEANLPEKLMLTVSELSEALEELRSGHVAREVYFSYTTPDQPPKPEGFGVELADAIIRILDMCGSLGIDIHELVTQKLEYNRTRPFRHGKQF